MPTRSTLLFLNQTFKEYKLKTFDIQKEVILKEYANRAILSDFTTDLYIYLSGSTNVSKISEKTVYNGLLKYCKDLDYQIENLPF